MSHATHPFGDLTNPCLDPIFWPAERIGVASDWWDHVPFGHWIVCASRPRVIVELGTGAGVSYSAFCQAVMRGVLDTRCYAIDTWPDVPDAKLCGEEMFEDLKLFHDRRYPGFSALIRSSFDEALEHFADRTVDLLHIDGSPSHDAVRHNFESWKPKLSDRAVVLFHNTNKRGADFGVWSLWRELSSQFPSFEFLHGNGLGVLAVGGDIPPPIDALCSLADQVSVRGRFTALGEPWANIAREKMFARELARRLSADGAELEHARAEARMWEARAKDHERAREQIALRIDAARRDVYDANLRVEQAEAAAGLAVQRAEQADLRAEQAEATTALAAERAEHVTQQRDALLTSTIWRATSPLRWAAHDMLPKLRRMFRGR